MHCDIEVFDCDCDKELRNGTDLDLQAYQDRAKREIFDPLLDRGGYFRVWHCELFER